MIKNDLNVYSKYSFQCPMLFSLKEMLYRGITAKIARFDILQCYLSKVMLGQKGLRNVLLVRLE